MWGCLREKGICVNILRHGLFILIIYRICSIFKVLPCLNKLIKRLPVYLAAHRMLFPDWVILAISFARIVSQISPPTFVPLSRSCSIFDS